MNTYITRHIIFFYIAIITISFGFGYFFCTFKKDTTIIIKKTILILVIVILAIILLLSSISYTLTTNNSSFWTINFYQTTSLLLTMIVGILISYFLNKKNTLKLKLKDCALKIIFDIFDKLDNIDDIINNTNNINDAISNKILMLESINTELEIKETDIQELKNRFKKLKEFNSEKFLIINKERSFDKENFNKELKSFVKCLIYIQILVSSPKSAKIMGDILKNKSYEENG